MKFINVCISSLILAIVLPAEVVLLPLDILENIPKGVEFVPAPYKILYSAELVNLLTKFAIVVSSNATPFCNAS